MKLLLIPLLLMSGYCFGQTDSARLKVTKVKTDQEKTHYWLKNMDTKENIYTVCECVAKHKVGEIVKVAQKDMIFYERKVSWRKVNN